LDSSRDVPLLNAFKGNDAFFMLFSFHGGHDCPLPASGNHVRKIELCPNFGHLGRIVCICSDDRSIQLPSKGVRLE
jgi:hypothetical protein